MARVLVIGASGFIGSAIVRALIADGHQATALGRDLAYGQRIVPQAQWRKVDLRAMTAAQSWANHVGGMDCVVNASGALQSGLRDDVTAVQREAIAALAIAAKAAGVGHFVQISAVGVDADGASDFMASKAAADAAILSSGPASTILRPGLVIGRNAFGGTELIRAVAGFPGLSPEVAGTGPIQCVALADIVEAVRRIVAEPARHVGSFDLVEAQSRSLGAVVAAHRGWLGWPDARWRPTIPLALLRPLTLVADLLGWLGWRSPLRSNAIAALAAGVEGDAGQARLVLGREPVDLIAALDALGPAGKADRWHSRLALVYPVALAALVLVWLASGILGLTRTETAAFVLERGGVAPVLARWTVSAGSIADIGIGMALVFRPTTKLALKAGLALALAYCIGAMVFRPDLWFDPLGSMLKVLPLIALTLACLSMADER